MRHRKSKFIWDSLKMELIEGKLPPNQGQLWKGENQDGEKMEMAGQDYHPIWNPNHDRVAYWGWSE